MTHLMKSLFICLFLFSFSQALIHNLWINEDHRGSFFIERFGFNTHGKLSLRVTEVHVDSQSALPSNHKIGFVIKHSRSGNANFIQDHEEEECLLDVELSSLDKAVFINDWHETVFQDIISKGGEGFYDVYFVNCDHTWEGVSFKLELTMFNEGIEFGEKNYLSVGDTHLPGLYGWFSVLYLVSLAVWCYVLKTSENNTVKNIHFLMGLFLLLKFLSILSHSVELHYLKLNGHPGRWTWIYLFFSLLKGTMFFSLIALIGSGWSFLKPFLSKRDSRILLSIVILQVIANIAHVVIEETAPGSSFFTTWSEIFTFLDGFCCVSVLVCIGNSLKTLQQASSVEGKESLNAEKLTLFKDFYLSFICYVYFTRIMIAIMNRGLPYRLSWFSVFNQELYTFCFLCIVGYHFRPSKDNPFTKST